MTTTIGNSARFNTQGRLPGNTKFSTFLTNFQHWFRWNTQVTLLARAIFDGWDVAQLVRAYLVQDLFINASSKFIAYDLVFSNKAQLFQELSSSYDSCKFFSLSPLGGRCLIEGRTYSPTIASSAKVFANELLGGYGRAVSALPNSASVSGYILQIDVFGPRIINENPANNSTFVNPVSNVFFDLLDREHSDIFSAQTYLWLNNILVVSGGEPVSTSGFGTMLKTEQTSYLQSYQFYPEDPWTTGERVVVSGYSYDTYGVGNRSDLYYSFLVWGVSDLGASINGLADVLPPYVWNIDPLPSTFDFDVSKPVVFEVRDDHTGVNLASVDVKVDGEWVIAGGQSVPNPKYDTSISGINDRNYLIEISGVPFLQYNKNYLVEVAARDNYVLSGGPNALEDHFIFSTHSNANLTSSGLYLDLFEPVLMSGNTSYSLSYSGVDLIFDAANLTGSGIDLDNSGVWVNGIRVSGNWEEKQPGFDYWFHFSLGPNFDSWSDLTGRVQESGSQVHTDFRHLLLWGYEACYTPENSLSKDSQLDLVLRASDRGDRASVTAISLPLRTPPFYQTDLAVTVVGIMPEHLDLVASYESNNTFYEYGKTMFLELEISDFAGNRLYYPIRYKIEG